MSDEAGDFQSNRGFGGPYLNRAPNRPYIYPYHYSLPPPSMMSVEEDPLTLWCLLLNDPAPFKITVGRRIDIADLTEAIKEKEKLHSIVPSHLVLWKVLSDIPHGTTNIQPIQLNNTEPVKPSGTLLQRIKKRKDLDATELDHAEKIAALFPQNPLAYHLHILVQVPDEIDRAQHSAGESR